MAGQRLIAFGGGAADIAAKGAADFVGGHVGLQNVAPQPDLRIGDARKRRIGDRCSGRQRAVKGGGSANGIWVRHQGVAAQGGQRLDQVAQRAARGTGFGAIRAGGVKAASRVGNAGVLGKFDAGDQMAEQCLPRLGLRQKTRVADGTGGQQISLCCG